MTPASLKS